MRLALMAALVVVLIFRAGVRALGKYRGQAAAALGLGAIFAFTTAAIHSLGEFGLYIPAITVLATVVAALLCSLNDEEPDSVLKSSGRLARAVGVAACTCVAILLVAAGWRLAQNESLRNRIASEGEEDAPPLAAQIARFEDALSLAPGDAEFHAQLAQAHLNRSEQLQLQKQPDLQDDRDTLQTHFAGAMRHFLLARDLCPLLPSPHLRIAANRESLQNADARAAYLARAKYLAPADPQLWYFCGDAGACRRPPGRHVGRLAAVARLVAAAFSNGSSIRAPRNSRRPACCRNCCPTIPKCFWPRPCGSIRCVDDLAKQRPYLQKAVVLLDERRAPLTAANWVLKADVYLRLDRPSDAIDAYRRALAIDALEVNWRFGLAKLLHLQGHNAEALRELRLVLDREPSYAGARELAKRLAAEEKMISRHATLCRISRREPCKRGSLSPVPAGTHHGCNAMPVDRCVPVVP